MTIHSFQDMPLDQLTTALVKAQAEFTAIPKDSTNPFFKSRYAGLPVVVEKASPILSKHGLSISQHIGYDGENDTLETWLLHVSGQYLVSRMRLHLVKDDPQGQGSAVTYARRYSYMSILGLVADDDDDGNAASAPRSAPRSAPAQQASSRPQASPNKPISEKQGKMLMVLLKKAGLTVAASQEKYGSDIRSLSSAQASSWIDELMGKSPVSNDYQPGEEPF